MRTTSRLIELAFLGALLLPSASRAEIAIAESTEWVLAQSDRVVMGKVVQIDPVADHDQKRFHVLKIAISKTLKGTHSERETVFLHSFIPRDCVTQWRDEGIPLIFCLIKNDGKSVAASPDIFLGELPNDGKSVTMSPEKFPWELRNDGNNACVFLLGKSKHEWTGSASVFTRDFEVLKESDAILKFVEDTLAFQRGKSILKAYSLDVPFDTPVHTALYSRSAVWLQVPVDDKLQALGRKWCASDEPRSRVAGARILCYFKNEANVQILKAMLADPATTEWTMQRTVPGKEDEVCRKKVYSVRRAAYQSLQQMKVNVKAPVLQVVLEGRDDPDLPGSDPFDNFMPRQAYEP